MAYLTAIPTAYLTAVSTTNFQPLFLLQCVQYLLLHYFLLFISIRYISLERQINKYDVWDTVLAADDAGDAVLVAPDAVLVAPDAVLVASDAVLAANDAGNCSG